MPKLVVLSNQVPFDENQPIELSTISNKAFIRPMFVARRF